MEIFHTRAALAVALCLAAGSAAAQVTDPAKLFAKPAEYTGATLSPNGDYVAVSTPFEDRRALSILRVTGTPSRSVIKFDAKEIPAGFSWTDDTRLVVSKARDYGLFGGQYLTGDVYAADADASNQVQLFGYIPDGMNIRGRLKDRAAVGLLRVLPETKGDALFYYVPRTEGNSKELTNVLRVDTYKGSRKTVESFNDSVSVVTDQSGEARFTLGRDIDANQEVRYRRTPGAAWQDAPKALVGTSFNVWYFEPDGDHAIAQISEAGEPASLYRISTSAGTREKLLSHPTLEATDAEYGGFRGPPVVIGYDAGKPKIDFLDKASEWTKLHAGLMKAFPGQLVSFHGFSRDSNKLLFFVHSDRHPGAYYLIDRTTKSPQLLFETMEWIDPAKMSPMAPIEFKNRTGETIYAFYTAPQGKPGAHPLVVMPHGGPFGVHDSWGFDPDVQFLATLGYAVLQVNYRGSGGRGDDFETSTYRQWGTGIQDDITDAVKHVTAQGLANPGKLCIYGASFGGYSAMMNPILNPGMYKCAIGYAGIYNLARMRNADDSSKQDRAWFLREVGTDEAAIAAQSPDLQVAKLGVPMLLIHGKSDEIAPIAQFDGAVTALARAGKTYETLAKADEGHGFYKEKDRVEAYERIRAFLLKYNPPN